MTPKELPGWDRGQREGRLDHGPRVTVTTTITGDLVGIGAQTFTLGSDDFYPEEAPARRVAVGGFAIERHPVTTA